jgi:TonB family protein
MIEFVVKVTLLLSLAGVLSLLPRLVSAELRSAVTLVSFAAVVVLLAAMLVGGQWTVWQTQESVAEQSSAGTQSGVPHSSVEVPPSRETSRLASWSVDAAFVWWVFGLVAGLLVLRALVQVWRCHRFIRTLPDYSERTVLMRFEEVKAQAQCRRQVALKQQPFSASPFTWGTRHPVLALPMDFADWTSAQQRHALRHELAHIQRYHCATLLFVQMSTALLWWHPLAWWLARTYRQDIERVCDDDVLACGAEPRVYAAHLIEVARHNDLAPGLNLPMAAGKALKNRISALLAKEQRRSSMNKTVYRTTLMAIMGAAYALGVSQVSAAPPVNRDYLPVIKFAPAYPAEAQAQRIEGYVLVEFDVDPNGAPQNISVVEQEPADGTFAASAVEAVSKFYYLPSREAGENVVTPDVRNRITFALDDPSAVQEAVPPELAVLAAYPKANAKSRRELLAQLGGQIEQAEHSQDGHRFALLASYAMQTDPSVAEYLFLRASQMGSSKPDYLKTIGGMVMFNRGALEQARVLFGQVSMQDESMHATAQQWIVYLAREIERRDLVRDALMDLHS